MGIIILFGKVHIIVIVIILHPQNAAVRAAAVSVLAKFGAQCETLLSNVLVLLQRCMMDTEDEVRDRATYYHAVLATRDSTLIHRYILNPPQVCVKTSV